MAFSHAGMFVSRRAAFIGVGAASLGLALAWPVAAQESSPVSMTGHPLVGTWIIHFEDPAEGPAVGVWGADGSFVDAGSGHAGVWQATGPTTALHSWVHVFAQAGNYVVVSGTIEVDASGDTWTQPYTSMVVTADGTVVGGRSAIAYGTRFRPVPEDEMGTPLEVVPTWTPATPEATPAS
jgi:hypothetical protein